jgi:hypothetical protein
MADMDRLYEALRNADAAGDVESAKKLAAYIRQTQFNQSAQQPETFDPTEGMSTTQKVLVGVGKGMTDIGYGAGQMLGLVSRDDVAKKREIDRAIMNTGAGKVGNFIGNAALAAPAALIPGANTMVGAGVIGAGLGFLQPSTSTEETLTNTALGGAGGVAGKWVGDKVVNSLLGSRIANARTGAQAGASSRGGSSMANASASGSVNLRGSGGGYNFGSVGDDASAGLTRMQKSIVERNPQFKLTPGQASGSRALQQFEAKLESQPMTSGPFNRIKSANQTEINRRVSDAIGVRGADVVDSATLDQAHRRIDRIYSIVRGSKDRVVEPDAFLNGLQSVESNYNGLLFTNGKPYSVIDHPLVSQLYNQASKGQLSARQLVDLSSKMGKAARSQMTGANGDRQLGMALNEVKDIVDDMVESGLNGKTRALFSQARGNYRNLMTIESNVGIVNPSTGNVSGANLANALARKDKAGFLLGRNESPMYDAARFAQAFKPIVGDSGTATRMPLPSPTDFVLSAPFNLAARAYTSSPAVNLAVRANSSAQNGLAPVLGLGLDPWLSRSTAIGGGLLATQPN